MVDVRTFQKGSKRPGKSSSLNKNHEKTHYLYLILTINLKIKEKFNFKNSPKPS